jgi:hypothetical protein
MSSSRHGPVFFLLRVAVFLVVLVASAEVLLRTVVPACEMPFLYQDAVGTMIMRFDPSVQQNGRWTDGRLARNGGDWRINNAGWNSTVDYVAAAARKRPMVALFGDSFIEGFPTNVDQHVDAYLEGTLSPASDVYAFGQSGWYLEQYVATSRYVAENFKPAVLVIFIDEEDVSDSVRETKEAPSNWWQITETAGGFAEVPPKEIYTPTRRARLSRMSAIANYLRYNAKVALPGMRTVAIAKPPAAGAGSSRPTTDNGRALLPAADHMVSQLCAENPGAQIVFVAHGDRYLSAQELRDTPLFPDALAIKDACIGRPQCHFLDLRPVFSRDWAAHRRSFEAGDGSHWNAYGNRLVAEAVARFIQDEHLLDGSREATATSPQ